MALTDNLVSYWKLEGNSNDAVGTNNGTDTDITYNTSNGKIGQGAGFNGTTSQIVFADTASLKVTSNFTISCWINTATPAAFAGIFWNSAQLTTTSGLLVGMNTNGTILFRSSSNSLPDTQGVQWQQVSSVTNCGDSKWRLITCVWDGSNLIIYVNGRSDNSIAWTVAPAYQSPNYPRLGADNLTGGTSIDWYGGKLDEVGFWSRALSPSEVLALYDNSIGLQYPFTFWNFAWV